MFKRVRRSKKETTYIAIVTADITNKGLEVPKHHGLFSQQVTVPVSEVSIATELLIHMVFIPIHATDHIRQMP